MDSDDSGDDAPSKRSRSKATAASTDDPQTFTKEVLQRMTVADLKELCREKGLKLTGKKDELIDRLLS